MMKQFFLRHSFIILLVVLVGLNIALSYTAIKWDMTDSKRFTLTKATKKLLGNIESPVRIQILFDGTVKASSKNFAKSIEDLLLEFQGISKRNISFSFSNPLDPLLTDSVRMFSVDSLQSIGLQPYTLRAQNESIFDQRQRLIIPGAILSINGKSMPINFFQGIKVSAEEELFARAEALLEYKFSHAIEQLTRTRRAKIYFSASHNEPMDVRMVDFFTTIGRQYDIDTLGLNTSSPIPSDADILMIFYPSTPFLENEKMKLDHYVMNGGKVIFWLNNFELNNVEQQSTGNMLFVLKDNKVDDLLFQYGCKISPSILKDLQCATLPMVVGNVGNKPQIEAISWPYYAILNTNQNHLITKNLDPVLTKYTNWIDTVSTPTLQKTPLLFSSDKTMTVGLPAYISLADANTVDPILFTKKKLPVAYLIEGIFPSLYFNRLTPSERNNTSLGSKWKKESTPTSILVVANPEIIMNAVQKNGIIPMGYSEGLEFLFSNKTFLLNSLSYLSNPEGVISARSKDFELQLLNIDRIKTEATFWRIVNLITPLIFLSLLAIGVRLMRIKS